MFWTFRQRVGRTIEDARALRRAVRAHGRAAREATGKSVAGQIAEMVALRRGVGRLAPDEYYQYCLFDDARFTTEQKRAFLGRQLEYDLWKLFDSWPWHATANDKLVAYSLFEALKLPSPRLYAVFHPIRRHGGLPVLRDAEELRRYVRGQGPFPMLAKPVLGMWGKSVYALERYDSERDELVLGNGKTVPVEAFVAALAPLAEKGYLFQELLQPHPTLSALCGSRICSVRMVTVLDPEPTLISTLWKVASGGAMADNFWEPGNLVGPVDAATGEVGQLFSGFGLDRRDVSVHPDTGKRLVGIRLPDWQEAREVCLQATASFPGLKMQAWDIALTDRGPVLLEVNIIGGLRLPQLVVNAGMNQGRLRELLRSHGLG